MNLTTSAGIAGSHCIQPAAAEEVASPAASIWGLTPISPGHTAADWLEAVAVSGICGCGGTSAGPMSR